MTEITWAARHSAREYCCMRVDSDGRQLEESVITLVPTCTLNVDPHASDGVYVRLFACRHDGHWDALGPPARLAPPPLTPIDLIPWSGRGEIHRLQVHDLTTFRIVFDEPVLGDGFPVSATGVDLGHELRYTLSLWENEDWIVIRKARPFPTPAIMGERQSAPAPLSADDPPALLMLFTVDTEAGMHRMRHPNPARAVDELIFGDFGRGENLGLGLHMDLLEHFGHRGCFFVDILMELQFGRAALERTLELILSRGHEVQLHIHTQHLLWHPNPTWRARYRALEEYDKDGMRHVMELSVDLFERRVGKPPLAYRAGGFQIDDDSLQLVSDLGIPFDSSNLPYYRARTADWTRSRTQPFPVGSVLEFPPSWFLRCDEGTRTDTRLYAPNPTAGDPLTRMLGSTLTPHVVNFVSHSFQLMRYVPAANPSSFRDQWVTTLKSHIDENDPYVQLIPTSRHRWGFHEPVANDEMVATVAHLLRRMAERPDARCVTFEDLHGFADSWWRRPRDISTDPVVTLDSRRGIYRQTASQVYNSSFLRKLECTASPPPLAPEDAEIAALKGAAVHWSNSIVAIEGGLSDGAKLWLCQQLGSDTLDARTLSADTLGSVDIVIWMDNLHKRKSVDIVKRLSALNSALRPGGQLIAVAWTLGVGPSPPPPLSLPLAELLFSEIALTEQGVTGVESVTALDYSSWQRWLRWLGFDVASAVVAKRPAGQLEFLREHAAKVRFLDRKELAAAAVALNFGKSQLPRALSSDSANDVKITEPEMALAEARRRFAETNPGDALFAALPSTEATLLTTSALLAWLRAGFEVVGLKKRDGSPAVELVRPLSVRDIDRFGGKKYTAAPVR